MTRISPPRRTFDWLFRSREDGRIVIAQVPNVSLGIFLGVAVVRWLWHPGGTPGTVLDVVASAALTWWSVDEILRGVNPFRRILGGVVLVGVVIGLAGRL